MHFSFDDISNAVHNIKQSSSKYLLTTTFTSVDKNRDIATGDWRPLNLLKPPFNFEEPILTINENSSEFGGNFIDKSLSLVNRYSS